MDDMAVLGNSIGDLAEEDGCMREGGSTRSSSDSSRRDSLPLPPPRHVTTHQVDTQPYQLRQPKRQNINQQSNTPSTLRSQLQTQKQPETQHIQAQRTVSQNPQAHLLAQNIIQNPPVINNSAGASFSQVQHNAQNQENLQHYLGQQNFQPINHQTHRIIHHNQTVQPTNEQQAPRNRSHLVHQTHSMPTQRHLPDVQLVHKALSAPNQGRQIPQIPTQHRLTQQASQENHNSRNWSTLQQVSRQEYQATISHQIPQDLEQETLEISRNITQDSDRQNLRIRQIPNTPNEAEHEAHSDNIPQVQNNVESPTAMTVHGERLDGCENESDYDSLGNNTNSLERNLNSLEPNKIITKAVLTSTGGVETLTTSPELRRPIFSFEEQRASPALLQRAGGTPGGRSRDDGYSSAGSTPLGRGVHKSTRHDSVVTMSCYKKEPKVQIDDYSKDSSAPVRNYNLKDGVDDGRETWGTGADFLLSIIGFAVDLANVWRFPYLCYRNGGGAFLIPYTLMLVFGAMPLFYMELILGQYNRQGPISLWKICPLFKGVGFCAVMVAFYVSFYYNVIIGWAFYFLVSSARTELPWIHCDNSWNTDKCWNGARNGSANRTDSHYQGPLSHFTPASEFFHRAVLEMQHSEGLNDLGLPKWQLALCLGAVYFTLYLSLFKGVKSSGKVVWATATLPYVVLSILLVRGLLLPGAARGIAYYLQPELQRLKDTQVWVDAAVQIFYSVGAGFGVHLSYASYNTFHNNCYRDCLVTTLVNCFTSFFSGFVIFTYLGFMSHKQGVPISAVATEGPGLVFQVYPEAVATLPGASIWAMLFFFMLIMLGLDSGMGGLECVITGLLDEARSCGALWLRREHFTLVVVCVSFCVACINVTPGGIYMFHLLDTYAAGISLLCSALFEAVAVSWFYGLERFSDDVEEMLGFRPGLYWRICWKFVSPVFIIGVVVFGLLYQQPLQYQDYTYPEWAAALGWALALSSILMIPACAVYKLLTTPGNCRQKVACCVSPESEHDAIRNGAPVTRFRWRHWLYV